MRKKRVVQSERTVVHGERGARRAAWCNDGRDERALSVVQGERGAKEEGPKRAASDLYESGAASTAPSGSSSDRVSAPVWPWWAWWAWCARGLVRKKRVVLKRAWCSSVVRGERGAPMR